MTIFARRARMHRGEFYKNIFTKRSTRSTWEFKDTALLAQIAVGYSSKNILHSCHFIHTERRRPREIWKNQGTSNIRGNRHDSPIPISNGVENLPADRTDRLCVIADYALIRKYCRHSLVTVVHFVKLKRFYARETPSAAHSWNIFPRLYDLWSRFW